MKLCALLTREVDEYECETLLLVELDDLSVELYFVQKAVVKIEQHQYSLVLLVEIVLIFAGNYAVEDGCAFVDEVHFATDSSDEVPSVDFRFAQVFS